MLHPSMLFHDVTSQLERVQCGKPASVAHNVQRLDANHIPGHPSAVRLVPVGDKP